MQMALLETRMMQVGRYAALAALFCVPISVAAVNVFVALIAVCVLFNPLFWHESVSLWRIPIVKVSLCYIIALSISTLYSSASFADATNFALKEQKKLLLIPFLIWLFRDACWQGRARTTLFISLSLVLLLSYANYFFQVNLFHAKSYSIDTDPGVVFHNRISQGFLTAFLAGFSYWMALNASSITQKVACGIVALLAVTNVMLMMYGRSGQVALLLLMGYLAFETFREKSLPSRKIAALAASAVVVGLLVYASVQMNNRLGSIKTEIIEGPETSIGMRLAYYEASWELFKERPMMGFGAGSVEVEAQRLIEQGRFPLSRAFANPHNQYFLEAVQMGIVGLTAFIALVLMSYRSALHMSTTEAVILRSYIVLFTVLSCANSLLLDFVEGHMFVLLTGIFLAPLYTTKAKVPLVA